MRRFLRQSSEHVALSPIRRTFDALQQAYETCATQKAFMQAGRLLPRPKSERFAHDITCQFLPIALYPNRFWIRSRASVHVPAAIAKQLALRRYVGQRVARMREFYLQRTALMLVR